LKEDTSEESLSFFAGNFPLSGASAFYDLRPVMIKSPFAKVEI
jgi:hypothetical protein